MSNKLLIVDFSNTLMRSLAVNQNLTFNGQVTGGLYGVVHQLVLKLKTYQPSHIVFCTDSHPYLRSKYYPEYKANRKKNSKPDWFPWVKYNSESLIEFLNLVRIPIYEQAGLEADDLIAALVRRHCKEFEQVIVLSNDDDLYQLLDATNEDQQHNVILSRKSGDQDYQSFKKEYPELEPKDWIVLTAMTGTHNNITGIYRCGAVTAYKLLKEYKATGTLPDKMKENEHIIRENSLLIKLPLPGVEIDHLALTTPEFKQRAIMRFLTRFGITYTNSMNVAFDHYTVANQFQL